MTLWSVCQQEGMEMRLLEGPDQKLISFLVVHEEQDKGRDG